MRTRSYKLLAPVLLAALTLGVAGCDSVNERIDEAQSLADDARDTVEGTLETLRWCGGALKLGAAVAQRDVEAARSAAEDLADKAPEELRDEVATIVAAVEEAEAQDSAEPLRADAVRTAGEEVLSYSKDRCSGGEG